jgi:tRNA-dependent cyclodipeptide synthase
MKREKQLSNLVNENPMIEYFAEKARRHHWKGYKHAFLGISMLNPNHHGEKFEKIIEWVNKQENFENCFIYLADSLYRHHFMMQDGLSEKDAYEKAVRFGDKWLTKHTQFIEKLNIPYRIVRWDEHWQNPYLRVVQDIFLNEYEQNSAFQRAVRNDVECIFARRGIETNHILPKELVHCRNFILEELAIDSLFFQKYEVAWIYPGKALEAYTYLRTKENKDFAASFKNHYPVRLMSRDVAIPDFQTVRKAA